MILWWLGNLVLLAVVLPLVVFLLRGVLDAAKNIVPIAEQIDGVVRAGSLDLNAVPLLLTTQGQVKKTVAGITGYGASLDLMIDDHGQTAR